MIKYVLFFAVQCTIMHADHFYQYHLSSAWYQQGKHLKVQLNNLNAQAQNQFDVAVLGDSVKALIVPHAAYQYSGVIAASAYRSLEHGVFKRVIILAPSHFASFEGVALPGTEYDYYKSRVGFVPLDMPALRQLQKELPQLFAIRHEVHEKDHAIEMQVPLIQKYCGDCAIVPLFVGSLTQEQLAKIVQGLQAIVDGRTLIVVSSDMVHYGSSFGFTPFKQNIADQIVQLDSALAATLQAVDLPGFESLVARTGATVCGKNALACLLGLLQTKKSDLTSYVTGYARSAGAQKNPDHSVSYLAIVFSTKKRQDLPLQYRLTGYEQQLLLQIARDSLHNFYKKEAMLFDSADTFGVTSGVSISGVLTQGLLEHHGVFVTLKDQHGQLRGCMGRVVSDVPLYRLVHEMAQEAAVHDTRFSPVTAAEVEKLAVSVSVLTQPYDIPSYKNIDVETDGVIVGKGDKTALFLPEVATEHGWNLSTMLSQLCLKAGLPADAWQHENLAYQVFGGIHIV